MTPQTILCIFHGFSLYAFLHLLYSFSVLSLVRIALLFFPSVFAHCLSSMEGYGDFGHPRVVRRSQCTMIFTPLRVELSCGC
jgi:hypothetical protein